MNHDGPENIAKKQPRSLGGSGPANIRHAWACLERVASFHGPLSARNLASGVCDARRSPRAGC